MFEKTGDRLNLAYALQNLANNWNLAEQGEEALGNYARALEIFASLPDGRRGRGITLCSMAYTLNNIGRYHEAIAAAEQAREVLESIGADQNVALALGRLADANKHLSNSAAALEFHQSALVIQRRINHKFGQANTLYDIGQLYGELKQIPRAREALQESLAIFTELDAPKVAEVTEKLNSI